MLTKDLPIEELEDRCEYWRKKLVDHWSKPAEPRRLWGVRDRMYFRMYSAYYVLAVNAIKKLL